MRKLLCPVVCAGLLLGCSRSQTVHDHPPGLPDAGAGEPLNRVVAPDEERSKNELLKLEADYSRALITKDRPFLMAYYAPDWQGGNWLGFWTKSTMLKAVLDERYVVRSSRLTHLVARMAGKVGIVQGISDEVSTVDGRDTSGKWSFTDVFLYRDGRWVAVASQTSEVKSRT